LELCPKTAKISRNATKIQCRRKSETTSPPQARQDKNARTHSSRNSGSISPSVREQKKSNYICPNGQNMQNPGKTLEKLIAPELPEL
jgi:ribosome assembly protein YihI (activator of Der GTPase)